MYFVRRRRDEISVLGRVLRRAAIASGTRSLRRMVRFVKARRALWRVMVVVRRSGSNDPPSYTVLVSISLCRRAALFAAQMSWLLRHRMA